ncbi:Glycosyl transferase, group 1 [Waddlia chondrophila WSU 86-1044]|uniref:Glycosyl transferase, group 1 n=2 Tax=Waddlia chondrophila TaxID=71667 RepID=D6YU40_WADCW|nr:Glycosyl transferase, group 1 [Waddlia chondrophila WSU 86-1044]
MGGSGVVATELGHVLASKGHQVHFITYEVPFRLRIDEKNIFFHQVEINRYDLFKYPDYALPLAVKIASVSKKYSLDIIHAHYAIPHATSAYLAKQIMGRESPKVITTLHGTDITLVGRDPAYFEIVKYSIEHSDAVTSVSESLRRDTVEWFGIERPIEVIHNFFIPKRKCLEDQSVREHYVSKGEKLIIHASNFRRVKRPEDVVRVFHRIKEKIPAKLLLMGTGEGIEVVRHQVKELGIEDDVFFKGKERNIDPYVASSDLFLLPSSQESFGLAALEAMSYGVPVIATQVGGLPELIEHGVSGFLTPVGDIETMSNFAINLLSDPKLYQRISRLCRLRAREKFCISEIYPKYLSLYTKMIG